MKSVSAFGQEHPLGPARAEPDAVHTAAPERDQRLRDLVAGAPLVLPRVQEREHARPPVGRREREHGDEADAEGRQRRRGA